MNTLSLTAGIFFLSMTSLTRADNSEYCVNASTYNGATQLTDTMTCDDFMDGLTTIGVNYNCMNSLSSFNYTMEDVAEVTDHCCEGESTCGLGYSSFCQILLLTLRMKQLISSLMILTET